MPLSIAVAAEAPDHAGLTVRLLLPDERPADLPSPAVDDAAREPVLLYDGDRRLALLAFEEDGDPLESRRIAGAKAAAIARRVKAKDVCLVAGEANAAEVAALVDGFVLGGYRFGDYKQEEDHPVEALTLAGEGPSGHEQEAAVALIRAEATCFARDLVNRSPHDKTAPLLADAAREMAGAAGLRCEVWERERIEAERMGGLLAVNRGSVEPPRFVILEHAPPGHEDEAPVVLVGKAVVFDTGGLSLKPTKGSMDKMKADMAGGAAVMGTMRAIARLELPMRVIGLIPMTDNRPGGDAYVPGDVVTMRSGLRVEVLNTDAEGRMLLADALDYARELNPRFVVDLATLTGSAVVALGERVAAVMTHQDDGADARLQTFVEAGRRTGEYVHPMPMYPFFEEALETEVADLKNVGGREGGAITAAKFLERFTRDGDGKPAYPWVHIDIAGPAFIDSPQPYRPKGGTGFGTRLLVEVLSRGNEWPAK